MTCLTARSSQPQLNSTNGPKSTQTLQTNWNTTTSLSSIYVITMINYSSLKQLLKLGNRKCTRLYMKLTCCQCLVSILKSMEIMGSSNSGTGICHCCSSALNLIRWISLRLIALSNSLSIGGISLLTDSIRSVWWLMYSIWLVICYTSSMNMYSMIRTRQRSRSFWSVWLWDWSTQYCMRHDSCGCSGSTTSIHSLTLQRCYTLYLA